MFLTLFHIKNSHWWKSIFFIGLFVCLSSQSFSRTTGVDLGQENAALVKTENSISSRLNEELSFFNHRALMNNNKYFSTRTSRRSIVNVSKFALSLHKPIYFNAPTTVDAVKKAPIAIEYHECAIKLNDCNRIIHLFYLY